MQELTKKCTKCLSVKSLDEFTKNKIYNDGYNYWCKKCTSEYQTSYREKYKDKRLNYQKQYRKNNPEYQKIYHLINPNYQREYQREYIISPDKRRKYMAAYIKKNGIILPERVYVSIVMKVFILERDNNKCVLCNIETDNLIIHHIVPVKEDNTRIKDLKNLVSLCNDCHMLAHDGHFKRINKEISQKLVIYIESVK